MKIGIIEASDLIESMSATDHLGSEQSERNVRASVEDIEQMLDDIKHHAAVLQSLVRSSELRRFEVEEVSGDLREATKTLSDLAASIQKESRGLGVGSK